MKKGTEREYRDGFNSALSPAEEVAFQAWTVAESARRKRDVTQDLADYDLRGYWKAIGRNAPKALGHMPDTYKKPNHPTFSNESMYDGAEAPWGKYVAGRWDEGGYTPSPEMLANTHDPAEMARYFKEAEPDMQLRLPKEPSAEEWAPPSARAIDEEWQPPSARTLDAPVATDTAEPATPGQEAEARNWAALRGAGQGFTFGQSANIAGLLQALGERVLPDKNPTAFGLELPFGGGDSTRHGSFAEAFERNKGTTQRGNDAAWDAHPWLYGGGNALATLPTLFLPFGAAGRTAGPALKATGIGGRALNLAELAAAAPNAMEAGARVLPSIGALARRGAWSGALAGGVTGAANGLGDLLQGNYGRFAGSAALGAVPGAAFGTALAPLSGAVAKYAPALGNWAYRRAVKAAGPMLKDVRALMTTGRLESVGEKLMDRGLIRKGAGIEEIAGAVENAANESGIGVHTMLGELDALEAPAAQAFVSKGAPGIRPPALTRDFGPAAEQLPAGQPLLGPGDPTSATSQTIRELMLEGGSSNALTGLPPALVGRTPGHFPSLADLRPAAAELPGFNPHKVGSRLREELLNPLLDQPALMGLAPGLEQEIRHLESLGNKRLTFQRANDIKRGYDKRLNWDKEQTPAKELLKQVRGLVNEEIERTADAASTASGDHDFINRFRSTKLDYRDLRQVADFAKDQVARREANRFISPSDYGVGVGSFAAGIASGHPAWSVLMGLAGAGANKLARERGNSLAAHAALDLSRRLAIPGNLAEVGLQGLTSGVARYQGQKGLYDLLGGATLSPRLDAQAQMVAP